MLNLVIGHPTTALENTHTIKDIFEGLGSIELKDPLFILINLQEESIHESDISRLEVLLKNKKTPTLVLTNQENLAHLNKLSFVKVLPSQLDNKKIRKVRKSLLRFTTFRNSSLWIIRNKYSILSTLLISTFFLEPIIKILYFKYRNQVSFSATFTQLLNLTDIPQALQFWLLFPLCALALKKASWYRIICFSIFHLYTQLNLFKSKHTDHVYLIKQPEAFLNALILINLTIILFKLLPKNLSPFKNIKEEIFRKSNRIKTSLKTNIEINKISSPVSLIDLSITGALISIDHKILDISKLKLKINNTFIDCTVARKVLNDIDGIYTYGLKFKLKNKKDQLEVSNFIQVMRHRDEVQKTQKLIS